MQKVRPSALPNLNLCSRWVGRPRVEGADKNGIDEAADEGTLVHATLEQLAQVPVDKWDEHIAADEALGPALRPVVQEAADQVRDLFSVGLRAYSRRDFVGDNAQHYELPQALAHLREVWQAATGTPASRSAPIEGIFSEVGLDPKVTLPGTADLVAIQGNRAILVDFKTNRVIREHRTQLGAYVVGLFEAVPYVEYVEARIVAPRLGDAHAAVLYERSKLGELKAELQEIVDRAADPFTPGRPGEACVFCSGNGRCPYQAASLRDIPVSVESLVRPHAWTSMLQAVTPDLRSQRRKLVKWLEGFVDAAKEDDKSWAEQNPDADLPGFSKVVQAGRATLDKDRLAELNDAIRLTFGLEYATLVAFLTPDKTKLGEFLAMQRGLTKAAAELELAKVISKFTKRGAPIIMFRAAKEPKANKMIGE